MIARRVPDLGEVEPEQAVRGVEGGLDDALELEVGLDLGLVEVVLAAAQLLGVVAPVPRREREVPALLPHQLLQGVALAPGARHRRRSRRCAEARARASGVFAMVSASL